MTNVSLDGGQPSRFWLNLWQFRNDSDDFHFCKAILYDEIPDTR